jgi:hypothetical protein
VFFGAIFGFLCFLPRLLDPQYFGLCHKSEKWYADYTAACDSVLAQHPLKDGEYLEIPITDRSLPKIITDLHPIKIHISHQWFWMLLGSDSHNGFGLIWQPQRNNTDVWNLFTVRENAETFLYSTDRTASTNK